MGAVQVGGPEHVDSRGVAVKNGQSAGTARRYPSGRKVEDQHRDVLARQIPGHRHPHLPEPGDNDVAADLAALLLQIAEQRGCFPLPGRQHPADDQDADRGHRHRDADGDGEQLCLLGDDQAPVGGQGQQHEREFAALGEVSSQRQGAIPRHPEQGRQTREQHRLDRDQPNDHQGQRSRPLAGVTDVQGHADGDEEQPEQETAKRLNIRMYLMAELGVGDHDPGEKSAERHRQTGLVGGPTRTQHQKQGGAGEHLRRTGTRGQPQKRPEDDPFGEQEQGHGYEELHRADAERSNQLVAGFAGGVDEDEHGCDGEVLDQKDGDRRAA